MRLLHQAQPMGEEGGKKSGTAKGRQKKKLRFENEKKLVTRRLRPQRCGTQKRMKKEKKSGSGQISRDSSARQPGTLHSVSNCRMPSRPKNVPRRKWHGPVVRIGADDEPCLWNFCNLLLTPKRKKKGWKGGWAPQTTLLVPIRAKLPSSRKRPPGL